ncbi:hypothetical protein K1X12_04485 [Hyphomonas sp. WL0036]|uniref:hypothetical protein n=1 Tax=Hyphomonas sediminis TaxID=2866160 RepID=UPI001C825AB3|nr:hypothetical protein [Hyphomonas sediminis]MBY9066143.1 hypothetical protein [Hyphomonas sediminis]
MKTVFFAALAAIAACGTASAAPGVHVRDTCYVKVDAGTVVAGYCDSAGVSCSTTDSSCTIDGYSIPGEQMNGKLRAEKGVNVLQLTDDTPVGEAETVGRDIARPATTAADTFKYRRLEDDSKLELPVGDEVDAGGPCPPSGC